MAWTVCISTSAGVMGSALRYGPSPSTSVTTKPRCRGHLFKTQPMMPVPATPLFSPTGIPSHSPFSRRALYSAGGARPGHLTSLPHLPPCAFRAQSEGWSTPFPSLPPVSLPSQTNQKGSTPHSCQLCGISLPPFTFLGPTGANPSQRPPKALRQSVSFSFCPQLRQIHSFYPRKQNRPFTAAQNQQNSMYGFY